MTKFSLKERDLQFDVGVEYEKLLDFFQLLQEHLPYNYFLQESWKPKKKKINYLDKGGKEKTRPIFTHVKDNRTASKDNHTTGANIQQDIEHSDLGPNGAIVENGYNQDEDHSNNNNK